MTGARLFVTFSLVAVYLHAQALQEPAEQKLIFRAHGVGNQIYVCKPVDDKYAWTLKAPEAQLLGAHGEVLGRHFVGPTWEAADGSRVLGKPLASVPSPDPNSIPWLRVEVTRHDGNGIMSRVSSIQRVSTKGGKPPADGCDISHPGVEVRVPYRAEYYFYGSSR